MPAHQSSPFRLQVLDPTAGWVNMELSLPEPIWRNRTPSQLANTVACDAPLWPQLRQLLEDAVAADAFEHAAVIRDHIVSRL